MMYAAGNALINIDGWIMVNTHNLHRFVFFYADDVAKVRLLDTNKTNWITEIQIAILNQSKSHQTTEWAYIVTLDVSDK